MAKGTRNPHGQGNRVLLAQAPSAGGEAQQQGVALATAAAEGGGAVLDLAAAHLVHQRHQHPGVG
jgi:hypothetical protein